jgi:regulator of replication initiation timing
MTLTEQWKKGELEKGYYYVKGIQKYDGINVYWIGYPIHESERRWIVEVLAPVPSYEEWRDIEDDLATCDKDLNNVCEQKEELYEENQQLKKENAQLHKFLEEFNALDVAKENQQLKDLLKQWVHFYPIVLYEHEDILKTKDIVELYDKTTNAIGEKK